VRERTVTEAKRPLARLLRTEGQRFAKLRFITMWDLKLPLLSEDAFFRRTGRHS